MFSKGCGGDVTLRSIGLGDYSPNRSGQQSVFFWVLLNQTVYRDRAQLAVSLLKVASQPLKMALTELDWLNENDTLGKANVSRQIYHSISKKNNNQKSCASGKTCSPKSEFPSRPTWVTLQITWTPWSVNINNAIMMVQVGSIVSCPIKI